MLRQKVGVGERQRYERVDPSHSWNSNNIATNVLLYHLQRHSDHHANPTRRYQTLRDYEESPVLPTGYAGMIVLAIVPAVWRRVMDPRVVAHFGGDLTLANISPRKRDRILARYGAEASQIGASAVRASLRARLCDADREPEVAGRALPRLRLHLRGGPGRRARGLRRRHRLGRRTRQLVLPRLRRAREGRLRARGERAGVMRITVDRDKCEGLGMCEAMAHEYFELDDDDTMTVLDETPPEAERVKVHAAVEACPVMALSLAD